MGAAALTSTDTQYEAIGKQLHQNATVLIKRREGCDINEAGLLALLMLGGTAGWYGFRDLGIPLFHLYRQQLHHMIECGQFQAADIAAFYQDALICWGMLLSFVSDDDLQLAPDGGRYESGPIAVPATFVPHAWTGVAKDAQILITQVGGLVRFNWRRAHERHFTTKAAVELHQSEIASALRLEKLLHTWNRPGEASVSSTLDNSTPTWHLVFLAEAYRRTALLQLYRVFPDVIQERLRINAGNNPDGIQLGDAAISDTTCDDYLTRFALDTLEILQSIPLGSGSKDFHPFLLVACCSELRLSQHGTCTSRGIDLEGFAIDCPDGGLDVPGARSMITTRLNAFMRYLPRELLRKSTDIVKATFRRLDDNSENSRNDSYSTGYPVYWMDVMMDNDWDIVMA